jgi:hypothetical protein
MAIETAGAVLLYRPPNRARSSNERLLAGGAGDLMQEGTQAIHLRPHCVDPPHHVQARVRHAGPETELDRRAGGSQPAPRCEARPEHPRSRRTEAWRSPSVPRRGAVRIPMGHHPIGWRPRGLGCELRVEGTPRRLQTLDESIRPATLPSFAPQSQPFVVSEQIMDMVGCPSSRHRALRRCSRNFP